MTVQKTDTATNSAIVADYRARTPGSSVLFERARKVLPSGITHDSRYLHPFPLHVDRANGARKWDVDGNEYVDFRRPRRSSARPQPSGSDRGGGAPDGPRVTH